MTIHMQGLTNTLSKNKNKNKRNLLKNNIVPLMFKGDGINVQ